jgi:hypothetical protein
MLFHCVDAMFFGVLLSTRHISLSIIMSGVYRQDQSRYYGAPGRAAKRLRGVAVLDGSLAGMHVVGKCQSILNKLTLIFGRPKC